MSKQAEIKIELFKFIELTYKHKRESLLKS